MSLVTEHLQRIELIEGSLQDLDSAEDHSSDSTIL